MLVAESISFQGRHHELVPATSLSVEPGEMLLVVAEPQIARTALALMLTGRMKPKTGTVTWGSSPRMAHLRRHSAVVDSPNINEPEAHLLVRDVVSEDLSLIPSPPWRKPNPARWMQRHGFDDIAAQWTDAVDPVRLTDMLTALAAQNPQTQLLVIDSPDRHQADDERWLRLLEGYAHSEREFVVIALVARAPESWSGPVLHVSDTTRDPDDATVALAEAPTGTADPAAEDAQPEEELVADEVARYGATVPASEDAQPREELPAGFVEPVDSPAPAGDPAGTDDGTDGGHTDGNAADEAQEAEAPATPLDPQQPTGDRSEGKD